MTISATDMALRAWEARPERPEALADLARHFREAGMNEAAAMVARRGLAIPPSDDALFVEAWAREELRHTLSISGYYSRDPEMPRAAKEECDRLSTDRTVGQATRDVARRNLEFFLRPIAAVFPSWVTRRLTFEPPDGYAQMAPSVTQLGSRIFAAARCVNYKIDARGYVRIADDLPLTDGAKIHTRTLLLDIDPETLAAGVFGEILLPTEMPSPANDVITGFEDMRLFAWRDELWGLSAVLDQNPDARAEQWLARIGSDLRMTDARPINPMPLRARDKNWIPIPEEDQLRFIYQQDPTRIIDIRGETVSETVPELAVENMSGSSQGIPFHGGWLAVVHWREWWDGWPKYRHRFAWYDADLRLKRLSPGWIFADHTPELPLLSGYEYLTGIAHHPDQRRLILGFQIHEREAWVGTVEEDEVAASMGLTPNTPQQVPGAKSMGLTDTLSIEEFRAKLSKPASAVDLTAERDWALSQTNNALKDDAAVDCATRALERLNLPLHGSRRKNWDTYLAIWHALDKCRPDELVLDAGGDRNSAFLPALRRLGYTRLTNVNLDESRAGSEGGIDYVPGDITSMTHLAAHSVRFCLCQSVLEHGVDWRAFYREMARVMSPGGHLLVSVDYWEAPVACPWGTIFTPADVDAMAARTAALGLRLTGPVDCRCEQHWEWYGASYTFINLLFRAD